MFGIDFLDNPVVQAILAGGAIAATGGAAAPVLAAGAGGAAGAGAAAAGAGALGAGAAGAAGATGAGMGAGLLGAEAAGVGAGGLLGAEAAGTAAGSGLLTGTSAAVDPLAAYMTTGATEGSTLGSGITGAGGTAGSVGTGTTAGTLGQIKQAADYIKPVGQAAMAAGQVKGLLSEPKAAPIQAAPITMSQGGAQGLTSLYNQLDQNNVQRQQEEMQKRLQRRQLIGGR